ATPPTEIHTLSLHDALPILGQPSRLTTGNLLTRKNDAADLEPRPAAPVQPPARRYARSTGAALSFSSNFTFTSFEVLIVPSIIRSEEHTSELQSRENLVCRL